MARIHSEEMSWKPRRLRKHEIQARVAHLQKNLPQVVREVFAAETKRAARDAQNGDRTPPKKSEHAVLLWEPRSETGGY